MEEKFLEAVEKARLEAGALGIRIRPVKSLADAKRCLDGHRESDGFYALADAGRLGLSLEAIAVKRQYTALFSDDQANTALNRLLTAGYQF